MHKPVLTVFFLLWGCAFSLFASGRNEPLSAGAGSASWGIPEIPSFRNAAEAFFDPLVVGEIRIAIRTDEWNGLLNDFDNNMRNEVYREASCTITGGGLDRPVEFSSIGLRLRGNTSRRRPEVAPPFDLHDPANDIERVHLKLKFNHTFSGREDMYGSRSPEVPTQPSNSRQRLFPEVRGLNLKYNKDDPSYIRQTLSYEIYRAFGVQAPRTTYSRVYLRIGDGPERYMGLYMVFEFIDNTFIQRRFGGLRSTLFKNLWQGFGPADLLRQDLDGSLDSGPIGRERADPPDRETWERYRWNPYRPSYDLKEDPDGKAVDSLNALIALLNSQPGKEELESVIDVQGFLRALAVNVMVGQADDYWRGGNNYYLYRNPRDGRWTYLPYDHDRTFGITTFGPDPAVSSVLHWGDDSGTPARPMLVISILNIPEFKADYMRYLRELADSGIYSEERLIARIREIHTVIGPHTRGYQVASIEPFNPDTAVFSRFIRQRLAVLNREIK